MQISQASPSYSRRTLSRLRPRDVWVCWHCNGHEDVSRVLDLTIKGLFLEDRQANQRRKISVGMPARLDFLVQEGRIQANAIIRHVKGGANQGSGMGFKFTAVPEADSARLKSLIMRLRSLQASPAQLSSIRDQLLGH